MWTAGLCCVLAAGMTGLYWQEKETAEIMEERLVRLGECPEPGPDVCKALPCRGFEIFYAAPSGHKVKSLVAETGDAPWGIYWTWMVLNGVEEEGVKLVNYSLESLEGEEKESQTVLTFDGVNHKQLTLVLSASYADQIPGRKGELLMESLKRTFKNYASQPGHYMGYFESCES